MTMIENETILHAILNGIFFTKIMHVFWSFSANENITHDLNHRQIITRKLINTKNYFLVLSQHLLFFFF